MKRILVITVTTIVLFSCKKGTSNSPVYAMQATINSVAFNGAKCIATWTGTPNQSPIYIYGWGADTSTVLTFPYIYFGLSYPVLRGAYYLTPPSAIYGGPGGLDSATKFQEALYGTVVITDTFPKIAGTFSFTTADSTKVTNGSFTAKAP